MNKLVPAISKHFDIHHIVFIYEWNATDNDTTSAKFLARILGLYLFLTCMMYTFGFQNTTKNEYETLINCNTAVCFSRFSTYICVFNLCCN